MCVRCLSILISAFIPWVCNNVCVTLCIVDCHEAWHVSHGTRMFNLLQDRKAYRLSILICFAAVYFFFFSLVQLQPTRIELTARNFQETSGTLTVLDRRSPIFENEFWGDGVPQNVRKKRLNFDGGRTYCPKSSFAVKNFAILRHVAKVGCSLIQMKKTGRRCTPWGRRNSGGFWAQFFLNFFFSIISIRHWG